MSTSLIILSFALFTITLFSGCAQKRNASLACFKGSPACYTQQTHINNNCPNCHSII